jgi:hypothetical protein
MPLDIQKLREVLERAQPEEDWERKSINLTEFTSTADEANGQGKIWYSDGDQCAEVYDNMGIGVNGARVGELMVAAVNALPALLDAAARAGKYEQALQEIAEYKPIDFGGATKLIARKALRSS